MTRNTLFGPYAPADPLPRIVWGCFAALLGILALAATLGASVVTLWRWLHS